MGKHTTLDFEYSIRYASVSLALLVSVPFFLSSMSPGRRLSFITIIEKLTHLTTRINFSSNGHQAPTTARRHCGFKEWHANKQRQADIWNPSKPVLHIFINNLEDFELFICNQRAGLVAIRLLLSTPFGTKFL
jgi:hypothetical protein